MAANSFNQVLIGLGSNLEAPIKQVQKAIEVISKHPIVELKAKSSLYRSSPQGPQDQEDFINAVILIETPLRPLELLRETQAIENRFGRVKTRHWGERIIDLDILFFNDEEISEQTPSLTIPHPYALERDFVLIPALEIAPDFQLPDATALKSYRASCHSYNLQRIR